MTKDKENSDQIISIRLTKAEVRILQPFGGASAFMREQIQEKAGDRFKLKQLKQQILDRIEKDQKQVKDLDKLILEMEQKAEGEAEEAKKLLVAAKPKKPEATKVPLTVKAWIEKWKPQLLKKLDETGGLHEMEYKAIFDKIGIKNKDEADAWIRS